MLVLGWELRKKLHFILGILNFPCKSTWISSFTWWKSAKKIATRSTSHSNVYKLVRKTQLWSGSFFQHQHRSQPNWMKFHQRFPNDYTSQQWYSFGTNKKFLLVMSSQSQKLRGFAFFKKTNLHERRNLPRRFCGIVLVLLPKRSLLNCFFFFNFLGDSWNLWKWSKMPKIDILATGK